MVTILTSELEVKSSNINSRYKVAYGNRFFYPGECQGRTESTELCKSFPVFSLILNIIDISFSNICR